MIKKLRSNVKLLAVIAPILITVAVLVYAYLAKPFSSTKEFCSVFKNTGICCPSCGITRAAYCILNGEFKKAFYFNALFTVGIFPFSLILTGMGVNFYIGKRALPLPKYRWIYFYVCLFVVVLFTVIRNFTAIIL